MQQQFQINTGNPQMDAQQLAQMQQQYGAQGIQLQVQPQPTGGFLVTVMPPGAPAGGQPMGGQPMGGGFPGAPGGQPMGGQPMGGQPMGGGYPGAPGGQPMGGGYPGAPGGQPMGGAPQQGSSSSSGIMGKLKIAGGAVFVIIAIVIGVWMFMNPSMYVDNASSDELNIYLDGKKLGTIEAGEHKKFNVKKGEHELGWSKADEDEPKHTNDVELKMGKPHLYSPGKIACYRLIVDSYGNASSKGKGAGPIPLKEFYTLKNIDNWFRDNPDTVKLSKKRRGATRTALQRSKLCQEFAHCALEQREKIVACEVEAFRSTTGVPAFKKSFIRCAAPIAAKCPRK